MPGVTVVVVIGAAGWIIPKFMNRPKKNQVEFEDDELEENTVTDVFQKGYKLGDKVIRPAMVKTAN